MGCPDDTRGANLTPGIELGVSIRPRVQRLLPISGALAVSHSSRARAVWDYNTRARHLVDNHSLLDSKNRQGSGEGVWLDSEGPRHKLTPAVCGGQVRATFAEWDAYVTAGGCEHRHGTEGWRAANGTR